MDWLRAVEHVRTTRTPGVLVTIVSVRGHAPRAAGAKMVVTASDTWDTVGGGNLEAVAIEKARTLGSSPCLVTVSLSDKAPYQHGVQCCGGEVTLLLEPLSVAPCVAIFGVGHVGLELARILARHDLELHLVDTRPAQLSPPRLDVLSDARARIHLHDVPVLPELVLGELPAGAHVLVMTHDHAEDYALVDASLRLPSLGTIGLIGSSAKWTNFEQRLLAEGHAASALARVTTPIGLPSLPGKDPATIAVAVAADLLRVLDREAATR